MIINRLTKLLLGDYQPLNKISIYKKALLSNLDNLEKLNSKIKVVPVLKSNAYGHGLVEVAKILDDRSLPFFCVDSIYEAYELYKVHIKTPILIMGYVDPSNLSRKKLPFAYAAYNFRHLKEILKLQPQAKVHVFVDTGMNREGMTLPEMKASIHSLDRLQKKNIVGIMSHFGAAEQPSLPDTLKQLTNFKEATSILRNEGISLVWRHIANSSGLLNNHKLQLDKISNLARVGIVLYGIDSRGKKKSKLVNPILEFASTVVQIKGIRKGEKIGYDFTYQSKKDSLIAVIPAGYNDGIDRGLSNKGSVIINGFSCPIVGRVSMNISVVDVSKVANIKIGDKVIVYSKSQTSPNSIVNSAKLINKIPYELLVHLSSSIKRVVV